MKPPGMCGTCYAEGAPTKNFRPAKYQGQCYTHSLAKKRAARIAAREAQIERTYGITPDEARKLREAQNGLCALCGPWTGRRGRGRAVGGRGGRDLAVDHCHRTGRVRGFLCATCNEILGRWRDNPTIFLRAANYLSGENPGASLPDRDWSPYSDQGRALRSNQRNAGRGRMV